MAQNIHEEVQQILNEAAEDGIPGIVAEIHDAGGAWFGTAGVADLATGQRRQPGEYVHIGSSGKAFTAATVLALAAEGRLSLEDPVSTWLPGVLEPGGYDGDKITIRHLLNHTSGLFLTGLAPELQQSLATQPARVWSTAELVRLAVSQPPVGEPGERFVYSNGGYYLAGAIIERVTGDTYAAEVERTVIRPLGLTRTYVRPAAATTYLDPHPTTYVAGALKDGVDPATLTAENWASMIDHDKPPIDVTALNTSWGWAAGGIVSTTEDLTRFLKAIATGTLLPPAQHREMWTMVGGEDVVWLPHARYGLGVIEFDSAGTGGLTLRGVSGTLPGSFTLALCTGDGLRSVAIHANLEPRTLDVPVKIIKAMYGVALA
ncbi:serine hydrolase domain-containing protein [Nonomuraea gerenzanensis]|uniref:D-alanyl-D-alanine carboxypeptidase n=1 Tax=Nonomuraea gerenzanensis TaxID=93944 RepID=A0A1M4ED08_9ACTN|nr:serine hydrolase domain-containing protein [Nonomuraea gerenzanensis]UBU08510.1 beta-lactamase family protein [Nonomuraea gerenzanensis]SBO96857.1 D-alanyl-D-alanine carboxypeptidase [Nonomuraea gerenzanensis]